MLVAEEFLSGAIKGKLCRLYPLKLLQAPSLVRSAVV